MMGNKLHHEKRINNTTKYTTRRILEFKSNLSLTTDLEVVLLLDPMVGMLP
jgi:hypothetical protein